MKKVFLILVACVFVAWADQSDDNKLKVTGYAAFQGGHVISGTYAYENDINNYWLQKIYANIGIFKKVNDWFSITTAMEMQYRSSFKMGSTFLESQFFAPYAYIDQARGDFKILDNEKIKLNLTAGYFHFKYNQDVTNLGNTLFKSYSYPSAILPNEFDFPLSRLAGADLYVSFLDRKIFTDVLWTSSLLQFPLGDFSLTAILGSDPFRGITVKGGIQFDRLLPANEDLTHPFDARIEDPSTGKIEDLTYAGIKAMGCLNLDLKKIILGEEYPSVFGEEDLKIWLEGNVLGIKNYDNFYKSIKERTVIAFGLKVPTFKLLDILAVEAEWFGSKYPNSIERPINSNKPYPEYQAANYLPEEWEDDDWKWSVYAKKDISDLSLVVQFASDHLQLWSMRAVDQVFRDNLVKPSNWYYQFKIQYRF
jgi:hypothetical protein